LEIKLRNEKYERERQLEKDYKSVKKKNWKHLNKCLNKSKRWHKANNLRNYINEIGSKAIANNNLTEVTKTWLIWTRKKADWYDPFIESNDELLIEVNQDTLTLNRKSYY
jgi:hypothetical protein